MITTEGLPAVIDDLIDEIEITIVALPIGCEVTIVIDGQRITGYTSQFRAMMLPHELFRRGFLIVNKTSAGAYIARRRQYDTR